MWDECLTYKLFVGKWAVCFRSVEECHATFDCFSDHSYGLLLFGGWTVRVGQPHATEAER